MARILDPATIELRDRFATAAMQIIFESIPHPKDGKFSVEIYRKAIGVVAAMSYEMADVMLLEREK